MRAIEFILEANQFAKPAAGQVLRGWKTYAYTNFGKRVVVQAPDLETARKMIQQQVDIAVIPSQVKPVRESKPAQLGATDKVTNISPVLGSKEKWQPELKSKFFGGAAE